MILNKFQSSINDLPKDTLIGIAISGGMDSVCLLEAFIQSGFQQLVLLHVNFGLRSNESDEDEQFVRNLAGKYKLPVQILDAKQEIAALTAKTGIQEKARNIRYEWFDKLVKKGVVVKIATAHHAQDLAETFLINAIRKSGLKGLSSIPENQGFVIRPLLFCFKEEMTLFAKKNQLDWREDSSNLKPDYTRNLIRLKVFPLLETHRKGAVKNIQETVFQLKHEQVLLDYLWNEKWKELISDYPQAVWAVDTVKLSAGKEPLLMIYYALRMFGFNYEQCEEMIVVMTDNKQGGKNWLSENYVLLWHNRQFILFKKITISLNSLPLVFGKPLSKSWNHFKITWRVFNKKSENSTDAKSLKSVTVPESLKGEFTLRFPVSGDYIQPKGMKGRKKLSDVFIDKKHPLTLRKKTPVLVYQNEVVWIWNMMLSEKLNYSDKEKKYWKLNLELKTDEK